MDGPDVAAIAMKLQSKNLTLATAESCTAGLLAACLTHVPGASDWFRGGVVVYSNDLKQSLAGVKPETLRRCGAVSREVALELASGARKRCGADLGVGITGIAGPGGGTDEKPVGTVHLAVAGPSGVRHRSLSLHGDREEIRRDSVREALKELIRFLDAEAGGDG